VGAIMPSSYPPPTAEVVPRLAARDPDQWLKIIAWATIVGSALLILTFSFGRDQGIYALVGEGILHGKVPYRDLWDFKPPGIFFVYALAQGLFGKNMMAPRLLEVLTLFGSVAAMRRISGILFETRTVGVVAGAVTALIHAELDFWHTGQPETFGTLFTLVGLLLTVEDGRQHRVARAMGVGAVFGCAALLKPPLGGGVLVCCAYLAQRERTRGGGLRSALLPLLWVGVGFALPLALCLLWFVARGGFSALHWTLADFAPGYTKLSWEDRRASDMLYYAIEEAFFKFSALSAAGVIAAITIGPLCRREREGLFLVLGVIAIHVAGIAMQGKFFPYHYGATLPLIALIGGLGLYKLWRRCVSAEFGGALAFFSFVAVTIPMRYAVRDLPQFFWERALIRLEFLLQRAPYDTREAMDRELAYVADYNLSADREVAREIRAHTHSRDPVYVWGFEPVIYWLADRAPASRFTYDVPQRSSWNADYARRQLITELDANPPAVIVVQSRDVFPAVTGNLLDSRDTLPSFPELNARLISGYSLARRIEQFDIYVREPRAQAP
jgi:hypothetical protein